MEEEEIKRVVREGYSKVAKKESSCCQESLSRIGYSEEEVRSVLEGACSFGCGNPVAIASLREGEVVLDFGSGVGFDCFLAAKKVSEKGRVIGVDMTPEMIDKARENARKGNYRNVEFRLGEIENLPVADSSVDVVISNCVINLSPNKERVFEEAFRVLKPGGRLIVSDIVLLKELPEALKKNEEAYINCISGAVRKEEYIKLIEKADFQEIKVVGEDPFPVDYILEALMKKLNFSVEKMREIAESIVSIKIYGVKPKIV